MYSNHTHQQRWEVLPALTHLMAVSFSTALIRSCTVAPWSTMMACYQITKTWVTFMGSSVTTCQLQCDQTLPLLQRVWLTKLTRLLSSTIITTVSIMTWANSSCNLRIISSLNFRRLRVIALPCSRASFDFTSSREMSGGRSCKNGSERSWAVRSFTLRRASTWESSGLVAPDELSPRASEEESAGFDSHSILLRCQFSKPWLHQYTMHIINTWRDLRWGEH